MRRIIIALLVTIILPLTTAANNRKGVGCWRTQSAFHQAAARLQQGREAAARQQYRIPGTEQPRYFEGTKRGLIILAEFTDTKFNKNNSREKYISILNEPGYTTIEGFRGSVADYFKDQSAGMFDLEFDVVGPYTASHNAKYYGSNDDDGYDERPHELIIEMCKAADADVDYHDYDWDGDGEAEEVFVIYAGKSEADTDRPDLIWPHMWTLTEAGTGKLMLDSIDIDIYACANELMTGGRINGIGTICHEFSHCMGFPDFYDLNYSGEFGMGSFDIMSSGNYAGNSFCPVGYTAYEKMMCGWITPIELSDTDVTVDSLRPMSEHGDAYIIYNDAYPDEYYLIENRQKTGWDKSYPAKGLLISHVDYDAELWEYNIPNTILSQIDAIEFWDIPIGNDHQRMTLFHADNEDDTRYWNPRGGYYTKTTGSTDLYPYQNRDSLTATSTPAAELFHKNSEGTKLLQGAILDIKENGDHTMSFRYRAKTPIPDAIRHIDSDSRSQHIYTLDGRRVHSESAQFRSAPDRKQGKNYPLKKGIYIVDGKKVVF
jgi:M6 family metalloprotease-like protein